MSGDFRTRTRPRTRRLSPLRRSLFLGTRFYVFFFAKPREISLVLPLVVAHTYIKCLLCVSAAARLHSDVTSRWQFWPPFAPNFKFYVILLESDQQCRWSYGVVELASLSRAAAASRLASQRHYCLSFFQKHAHGTHWKLCVLCARLIVHYYRCKHPHAYSPTVFEAVKCEVFSVLLWLLSDLVLLNGKCT